MRQGGTTSAVGRGSNKLTWDSRPDWQGGESSAVGQPDRLAGGLIIPISDCPDQSGRIAEFSVFEQSITRNTSLRISPPSLP
jgi:hypothetical protein